MFPRRTLNNKINRLHDRCPRIMYNDKVSNFEKLVRKDNSVSIYHNTMHALATEMHKVVNGASPDIINEVFKQRNNPHCNLRHTSQFSINSIRSVYNGTESASYLGPKISKQIGNPLKVLSRRSRNGNQLTALVEFVKSSYQT